MTKTAIVLCGGFGKRLLPLTLEIPKPMVCINGKPMIQCHIDNLKKFGIKKIILACGYKWEKIKEHYGNEMIYSIENEPLGTAGAVKKALEFVDEDEFFVINVDDLSDVNFDELRRIGSNAITLSRFNSPFGIVDVKNGKVLQFREKPILPYWANIGHYILNKNISLPDKGNIEYDVFPKIELKIYKHEGMWITVNTMKQLEEAEEKLRGVL